MQLPVVHADELEGLLPVLEQPTPVAPGDATLHLRTLGGDLKGAATAQVAHRRSHRMLPSRGGAEPSFSDDRNNARIAASDSSGFRLRILVLTYHPGCERKRADREARKA